MSAPESVQIPVANAEAIDDAHLQEQTVDYNDQAALEKALTVQTVDVSNQVHEAGLTRAEHFISERTAEPGHGIRGIINRMWFGNIGRGIHHGRQASKGRKEAVESQNAYIYDGLSKDQYDRAMDAVVTRFVDSYHHDSDNNEYLQNDERNFNLTARAADPDQESTVGASFARDIKDLVKGFAAGRVNEEELAAAKNDLIKQYGADLNKTDRKLGLLTADNVLKVARHAKAAFDHNIALDKIDQALTVLDGEAHGGVRTGNFESKTDKAVNWLASKPFLRAVNETTLATVAGVVVAASNWTVKSTVHAVGATVGMGAGAALIGAAREHARVGQERRHHLRERAEGAALPEGDKRRAKLEESAYDMVSAREITLALAEVGSTVNSHDARSIERGIREIARLDAQLNLSEDKGIDLIGYTAKSEVEVERLKLFLELSKARRAVKSAFEDADITTTASIGLDGKNFEQSVEERRKQITTELEGDIKQDDKDFSRHRAWRSFKIGTISGASSIVLGTAIQEIRAVMPIDGGNDVRGLFESPSNTHERQTLLSSMFRHDGAAEAGAVDVNTGTQTNLTDTFGVRLPDGYTVSPLDNGQSNLLDANGSRIAELQFTDDGHLTEASQAQLDQLGFGHAETTEINPVTTTQEQTVLRTPEEYINAHSDQFANVSRDWYNNDTSAFDLNELRMQYGGFDGTGIDANGNYVFNVQSMMPDGSFNGDLSVDAQQLIAEGNMRIAFSMSEATDSQVFFVNVDANGNATVDANSFIGRSLFENRDGRANFIGAYAEATQITGVNADGQTTIRTLATVVGEDRAASANDIFTTEVTTDSERVITALSAPTETGNTLPVEVPFVMPLYTRRGLEKSPARNIENLAGGYYGYRHENLQDWAAERSPRFSDPNAALNPREELDWYRQQMAQRRGKDYVDEIDNNVNGSPELKSLNKDSRLIVSIPVAATAESDNIYKTLSLYAQQDAESLKQTTVLLNVNWIDDASSDPVKQAAIDKTHAEIERARQDFPQLSVATFDKVWSRDWVDNVRNGKMYGEVIKTLYDTAAMSVQQAMSNGQIDDDQDLLIVTNDADALGMSTRYLANYIKAESRNKESDAFVGLIRWGSKVAHEFPGYHVATSVMQVMNMVASRQNNGYRVQPATIGPNAAFRMSSYAGVGGCIDANDAGAGADSQLGRKILAARGFQVRNAQGGYTRPYGSSVSERSADIPRRTVIKHVAGADIDTAPDRLLTTYREGKFIPEAWGGFDNGGYKPRSDTPNGKLIKPETRGRYGREGTKGRTKVNFDRMRRRDERQISDFITHWYPDQALASWSLHAMFPNVNKPASDQQPAVVDAPAWRLTPVHQPDGNGGYFETYKFEFTAEGAERLRAQTMHEDSRGRRFGRRIQARLYESRDLDIMDASGKPAKIHREPQLFQPL